jgi:DNA-binding transcriptional LysR family regulator
MDWDKLKTFHAAAEAGSLTGAAEALGISQSAVSRQIASLEEQLGVALFHRHARGLQPTEQGRILFETAHDMSGRVALAEAQLADSRDKPSGELHVTAPIALGTTWLTPRLDAFMTSYPEIRLELILDDAEVDLSTFEVEAAIRLWRPTQPDLVQKKLLSVRQSLYAAPAYLARRPGPADLSELADHPLIVYGARGAATPMKELDWPLRLESGGAPRLPALRVNTVLGVQRAIESGLGVGSLPDYLARGSDRLVRILPDVSGPEFEVYFVYPEELRNSRRIGALRDFLLREARAWER